MARELTPEEIARNKSLEAKSSQAQPQQAQPQQAPGGSKGHMRDTPFNKEQAGDFTGKFTRGAAAITTVGASEIPLKGGSLGGRAQAATKNFSDSTFDFFKKLDPTNTAIPRASTEGMDTVSGEARGVGSRAKQAGDDLRNNPVQAREVTFNPAEGAPNVQAQQVRGTTQQVQAKEAETFQMTPAQIAEMREAQAAQIARGDDTALRERQLALASSLEAQAAGQGPSLAEAQLKRGGEQAIAAQAAMAASARGGNPILAQRQAAQQTAATQQDLAGRAAELRIQEQTAARQALGGVLEGARGQDIGVATSQAQLGQQAELSNVDAQRQRALAQAQLDQEAGKVNVQEAGETSRFNVSEDLKGQLANQATDLSAAQGDQTTDLAAQTTNQKSSNEMAMFNADKNLQAQTANQVANLQAQGMTLDNIAKMMGLELETLKVIMGAETTKYTTAQATNQAEREGSKNMLGNLVGTAGTVVAMCFPAGQQVLLADGSEKAIEAVRIGDSVAEGGKVLEVRVYDASGSEWLFAIGQAMMTGSHAVWDAGQGAWCRADEAGVPVGPASQVFTLVTETGTLIVGGQLVGDDEHDAYDLNQKKVA